jgi:hypothetical protein
VSITSLLEAGAHATPLVSRCPFSLDGGVLCADAPGFDGQVKLARTLDEYQAKLGALIDDAEFRREIGGATRAQIAERHTGDRWTSSLEAVYVRARTARRSGRDVDLREECSTGAPDIFLPSVFGKDNAPQEIGFRDRRLWPATTRLRTWLEQGRQHRLRAAATLIPEWAAVRLNAAVRLR